MAFPNLPGLVMSDEVVCIRNTWGVGAGGLRIITDSQVIGTFPAVVEQETTGTRSEGTPDGYDHAFEAYLNFVKYKVQFQSPDLPPGGLKPQDSILWTDEVGISHVLQVIAYWPNGNQTNLWYAKVIERS